MSSSKSEKTKLVSILINDELKFEQQDDEHEEDDEDSNEKPLIDKKQSNSQSSSKKKSMSTKKGGYYELSKQEKDNVNDLFESNNKIVNAVDYDDDEYEDDDELINEEDNEQTQLTKNFHKKKKIKHNDKRSIRKKLFGSKNNTSKENLIKQNSTDDEFGLGKIKILMPNRNKKKSKLIKYKLRKCIRNMFSLFFLISALIIVFILLYFKRQYLNEFVKDHLSSPSSSVKRALNKESKHCDMLLVNNYWNVSLPKLIVDAPLKLLSLDDNSNNLDILVPFQTSIDSSKYNSVLCQIYFNQTESNEEYGCGGGILLLDGDTGAEKWRVYTRHKINAVNCFMDLDDDGVLDCFATGLRAQFYAISGRSGRIIWALNSQKSDGIRSNAAFHMPLLLPRDLDSDKLNDIIVMHGGDYQHLSNSGPAIVLVVSSRTGLILIREKVPDNQDSYIPPVLYFRNQRQDQDSIELVYGTGSYNQPGALFSINLDEFLQKNTLKNSVRIYSDKKGILTPPILIDLNNDHIQDIVISLFNSTVAAFNGRTLVELWHTKFSQNSEFYLPPSVGYFDDDNTPDFLVQYELGDGFPNNYYSELQILNGKNGKPMLKDSLKTLIGSRSSPITISIDTKNKNNYKSNKNSTSDQTIESFDLFLFWSISCDKQEQEFKKLANNEQVDKLRFKLKFNSMNDLSKTDFCRLRFDKTSLNKLESISYGNILTTIYDSRIQAPKELEVNNRLNYTKIGADYLSRNLDLITNYMENYNSQDNNEEQSDAAAPFEFLNYKRNQDYHDTNLNSINGFYIPGLNNADQNKRQQDYSSSFKNRQNDYSFNNNYGNNQDKSNFNLQNFNLPNLQNSNPSNQFNENQYNQNNLVNLLNQFQQQQAKIPPPYNQGGFDLNNLNNLNTILNRKRNRFVKKKYDQLPNSDDDEQIFRRLKREFKNDDQKFVHKIYSTPTLAPSKLTNGIDIVFTSTHVPDNNQVKLIKKIDYDNCIQMIQNNKDNQLSNDKILLNDFINYCDKKINRNDKTIKKINKDSLLIKQMGSTTIYRNELKCKNDEFKMKDYRHQIWPNYMGLMSNGMANIN